MDHPFRWSELALKIVDESEPRATDRMKIIVRRGDDFDPRRFLKQGLQPSEGCRRVARDGERLDPMKPPGIRAAADAVGPERARFETLDHIVGRVPSRERYPNMTKS